MITTYKDYKEYLRRDARAHGLEQVRRRDLLMRPALNFQRRLRCAEYWTNRRGGVVARALAAAMRFSASRQGARLGFTVPVNVTGAGLCLAHVGTVVISRQAKIGEDCRIHAGTNIGEGRGGAPTLGDGCYVGPGAVLVGGIQLGAGCIVGANAVVTSSFGPRSVLIGVPARVHRLQNRPWPTTRPPPIA